MGPQVTQPIVAQGANGIGARCIAPSFPRVHGQRPRRHRFQRGRVLPRLDGEGGACVIPPAGGVPALIAAAPGVPNDQRGGDAPGGRRPPDDEPVGDRPGGAVGERHGVDGHAAYGDGGAALEFPPPPPPASMGATRRAETPAPVAPIFRFMSPPGPPGVPDNGQRRLAAPP